jgi:chorismate mutase-like protein
VAVLSAPFRSRSALSALAALLVAVTIMSPGTAAAAGGRASLGAAREGLTLTKERLDLMREVMASKWFSRAPIQDPAQEETVKTAAVAQGLELGVAAGSTRSLFAAEIAAAKEVQRGWGSHWLFYGAPADLAAPDLSGIRASLGGISERLVALLPRLVPLARDPGTQARVSAAAAKILVVPYLGPQGRAEIVEALLGIRGRVAAD